MTGNIGAIYLHITYDLLPDLLYLGQTLLDPLVSLQALLLRVDELWACYQDLKAWIGFFGTDCHRIH